MITCIIKIINSLLVTKVLGKSAILSSFKIGGGRGSSSTLVKIETQDSLWAKQALEWTANTYSLF